MYLRQESPRSMPFVIPKQNPSAIPIPHAKSNISRKGIPSFSNTPPKTHAMRTSLHLC